MNILVVDDEKPARDAMCFLIENRNKEDYKVFEAGNVSEAREILKMNKIHIIFCDIEMPGESGIEFLKWASENYSDAEFIMVSCHDNFSYAKSAMRYGSIDYLLKPVLPDELEIVFTKAVERLRLKKQIESLKKKEDRKDERSSHILYTQFWNEISKGTWKSREQIQWQAEKQNITYYPEQEVIPVVLVFEQMSRNYREIKNSLGDFALKNMIEEIVYQNAVQSVILGSEGSYVIVYPVPQNVILSRQELAKRFDLLIAKMWEYFECSIICYMGHKVCSEVLHEELVELMEFHKENVTYVQQTVIYRGKKEKESIYVPFDREEWFALLWDGKKNIFLEKLNEYLDEMIQNGNLTKHTKDRFYQEFVQLVMSVAEARKIPSSDFFDASQNESMFNDDVSNVRSLKIWCEKVVTLLTGAIQKKEKDQRILTKIEDYLNKNYDRKVSREELAKYLGFNCEYLSRIFKKETGVLLSDYINTFKLDRVKYLLRTTDTSVSDIALQEGYENFSNFTRLFKKETGCTPTEYRKQRK